MFCSRSIRLTFITILFCAVVACRRTEDTSVRQLAVTPFENLSSDASWNWAGRAAASALVYDLAPAPNVHAQLVSGISQALSAPVSEVVQGYFSSHNGQLRIVAVVEDLERSRTVANFELSGPAGGGILPLANELAQRISAAARPFGTRNPEAFRAYAQAIEDPDASAIRRDLESAITADPSFAVAYVAEGRLLLGQRQRDEGLKLLEAAKDVKPDAIDVAEIDYLIAGATGNQDLRSKSLEKLMQLTPSDIRWPRELAELRFNQRDFRASARFYEDAARQTPEAAEIWNQLGYAYAYAQDLTSARRALERYGEISRPNDSNALDSLGEVNFYLGDFAAAEKYFIAAQEKSAERRAEELQKSAQARLLAGDLSGADTLYHRYLALLPPGQQKLSRFEQAQWEFLTGRRKAAISELEQLFPSLDGDQQALVLCQLAVWKLESGARSDASALAEKAVRSAVGTRARNLAQICRYLAANPGTSSGSPIVDSYAMLFAQKYAEALPLLKKLFSETNPTVDGAVRTLLAWAYVKTQNPAKARNLVATFPLPLSSGDPIFASLIFPRFLVLRATVLDNAGKQTEAKQSRDLYGKYAGDVPDVFR